MLIDNNQQPFDNCSSVLYSHSFPSREWKRGIPPRITSMLGKVPTCLRRKCPVQFMIPTHSWVNQRKSGKTFYKTKLQSGKISTKVYRESEDLCLSTWNRKLTVYFNKRSDVCPSRRGGVGRKKASIVQVRLLKNEAFQIFKSISCFW